jgi:hypothetical protein
MQIRPNGNKRPERTASQQKTAAYFEDLSSKNPTIKALMYHIENLVNAEVAVARGDASSAAKAKLHKDEARKALYTLNYVYEQRQKTDDAARAEQKPFLETEQPEEAW